MHFVTAVPRICIGWHGSIGIVLFFNPAAGTLTPWLCSAALLGYLVNVMTIRVARTCRLNLGLVDGGSDLINFSTAQGISQSVKTSARGLLTTR
ncbi:hypothetical protein BC834DRAFT_343563 [Gloeopeniophorella convolvens]|nr:hypothetical protein BC834DRAFT_343563 [Gloeopeniophorella convolvens]